jgi:pimeloyl-ACP methyl ester carboxylesterase
MAYDCRGFGRSSCPTGPYNHADDLHSLLRHLGVSSAHLVGLSMGGRIALGYALRRPDRVASLAVIGSDVGGYRHRIDWEPAVERCGLAAARAAWLRHELFDTVRHDPWAWPLVRRMVADYSGWHWRHPDVRSPVDTDTRLRLAEITAPTTVVVGQHDLPDFHEVAALLVSGLPQARRVLVPGAGHLVNLEQPTTCNGILAGHLSWSTSLVH